MPLIEVSQAPSPQSPITSRGAGAFRPLLGGCREGKALLTAPPPAYASTASASTRAALSWMNL